MQNRREFRRYRRIALTSVMHMEKTETWNGLHKGRINSDELSSLFFFFKKKKVFRAGLGSSTSKSVVDQARMRKKKTMLQLMCKFLCGEKFKILGMFRTCKERKERMQSANKTCLDGHFMFVLQEQRCAVEDQMQKN